MRKNKQNYWDDYDGYTPEEFQKLKDWVNAHIVKASSINYSNGYPMEMLETLISGDNIVTMASLDCGITFDWEIIRLAMIDIDPFPIKIGVGKFYRAQWKSISSPGSSEKWRIQ